MALWLFWRADVLVRLCALEMAVEDDRPPINSQAQCGPYKSRIAYSRTAVAIELRMRLHFLARNLGNDLLQNLRSHFIPNRFS